MEMIYLCEHSGSINSHYVCHVFHPPNDILSLCISCEIADNTGENGPDKEVCAQWFACADLILTANKVRNVSGCEIVFGVIPKAAPAKMKGD